MEALGVNVSTIVGPPQIVPRTFECGRVVDIHAPLTIDDHQAGKRLCEVP
jgi:hypothetical protein